MNRKTEAELKNELDKAYEEIEVLEEKMDAIVGIAADEDADADAAEEADENADEND